MKRHGLARDREDEVELEGVLRADRVAPGSRAGRRRDARVPPRRWDAPNWPQHESVKQRKLGADITWLDGMSSQVKTKRLNSGGRSDPRMKWLEPPAVMGSERPS